MSKFSKPEDFGFLSAKVNEIVTAATAVKQKDFKAPPNHLQTVIDGMNMFGYIYLPAGDELRDWIKDIFDQISFYGNKVLKLDKEPDTKWFNAFKDLNSAILAFVLKRLTTITSWTG